MLHLVSKCVCVRAGAGGVFGRDWLRIAALQWFSCLLFMGNILAMPWGHLYYSIWLNILWSNSGNITSDVRGKKEPPYMKTGYFLITPPSPTHTHKPHTQTWSVVRGTLQSKFESYCLISTIFDPAHISVLEKKERGLAERCHLLQSAVQSDTCSDPDSDKCVF